MITIDKFSPGENVSLFNSAKSCSFGEMPTEENNEKIPLKCTENLYFLIESIILENAFVSVSSAMVTFSQLFSQIFSFHV